MQSEALQHNMPEALKGAPSYVFTAANSFLIVPGPSETTTSGAECSRVQTTGQGKKFGDFLWSKWS